ncbi:MAG: hypothetical protein ACK5TQ_12140 [Acetobacteraceae bacterium]
MFGASLYLRFFEAVGASLYSSRWVILIGAILAFMSLIFAPALLFPIAVIFTLAVALKFFIEFSTDLSDGDGGNLSSDGGGDGGGGGE